MKKFTIVLLCLVSFSLTPVSAYNVNNFTDDFAVSDALTVLKAASENQVFDNLEENSVKIVFYDLSALSYSYKDHFAISGCNNMGDRYILINSKYRNVPKEEIACLIAHESCHKAKVATIEEETLATETEAKCWIQLKQQGKAYPNNDLTRRLDSLAYLYETSSVTKNNIQERIVNSPFYREQLAIKPE